MKMPVSFFVLDRKAIPSFSWKSKSHAMGIFLFCSIITIGLMTILYRAEVNHIRKTYQHETHQELLRGKDAIEQSISRVRGDILYLAHSSSLWRYLRHSSASSMEVENDWKAFMRSSGEYDQIRLIDTNGDEVIRVNYESGNPKAIEGQDLQSKKSHHYVQQTLQKAKGQIYISPLDLNKEHGQIERPFKPMIRFGIPLYNSMDQLEGILVLNYLAQTLLSQLSDPLIQVVNQQGYWLSGVEEAKLFGFMFEHREGFFRDRPAAWEQMTGTAEKSIPGEDGTLVYERVFPFKNSTTHWYIIKQIPEPVVAESIAGIRQQYFAYSLVLFATYIVIAMLVVRISDFIQKSRQQSRDKLKLEGMLATVGTFCHEFNQPLTVIHGYCDLLRMKTRSDPGLVRYIDLIQQSSTRLTEIMERMRTLSKYRTIRYSNNTEIVDIASSEKAGREKQTPRAEAQGASHDDVQVHDGELRGAPTSR